MKIFNINISLHPGDWLTNQELCDYYNEKLQSGWELWLNGMVFDVFRFRQSSQKRIYVLNNSEEPLEPKEVSCLRVHLLECKNLLLVESQTECTMQATRINPTIEKRAYKISLSASIVSSIAYNALTLLKAYYGNIPMVFAGIVCIMLWSYPFSLFIGYKRDRQNSCSASSAHAVTFAKGCTVLTGLGFFVPMAWVFSSVRSAFITAIAIELGSAIGKHFKQKKIKEKMNLL